MRYIYTLILYLLMPLIIFRLYWKSRRLPAYWNRLHERLSFSMVYHPVDIWVHAVSLGEVVAATPFIHAMLSKEYRVMVTTMTPTGSDQVRKQFGKSVSHQYLPYDLPGAVSRFFKNTRPKLGIIMETELWPNLISIAYQMHIPLLLINARISDHAFKQYYFFRWAFKPILTKFKHILAQSEEDARRFQALGLLSNQIEVMGNLKFDQKLHEGEQLPLKEITHLPSLWGKDRTLIIAASTHNNEESQLLKAFSALKRFIPNALLLIAPRHPERFEDVFQLSQHMFRHTARRSAPSSISPQTEVFIIDTLGELMSFYALSDFAFVGGSLVPIGGHNVLEPISLHVPVFCGPYMNNSKSVCEALEKNNALQRVANAEDLMMRIVKLYQNTWLREEQIKQASAVLKANQGALEKCVKKTECILHESVDGVSVPDKKPLS